MNGTIKTSLKGSNF